MLVFATLPGCGAGTPMGAISGTGEKYEGSATIAVPADAEPGLATVSVGATFTAELVVLP